MKDILRNKTAKVLILLPVGMSLALIVALAADSKMQIEEFGLLSVYMFLPSLYATPQSGIPTFRLTTSAIYARIKTGELKISRLEPFCSLLTLAYGIAGFIALYEAYLR